MSDDEDFESENDFSASEDDWTPTKHKETEHSDDEDDEDEVLSNEDFAVSPPTKRKKVTVGTTKKTSKSKRQSQKLKTPSLRAKMFKKYKPPPKTISTISKEVTSSKFLASKSTDNNDSDSGSSVENFLVDPEKLDLNSSFFDVKEKNIEEAQEEEAPPDFDCNVGLSQNDTENEEDDFDSAEENKSDKNYKNNLDVSPFKQFYDYKSTIDQVKKNIKSLKSKPEGVNKQDDISSILALGEASTSTLKKDKAIKRKQKTKNSDSEWEEVEEDQANEIIKAKDGIEITVGFPEANKRRDKKVTDEQAQMMRKLNRIIKENCLIFHKVSLLCHIAHGIYLNKALSNATLMEVALKLLPSEKSYPNGRTCITYFEAISKWYKATMQLKNDSVYSNLKNKPAIPISLGLQIKSKSAICKKDFVLIFIVLLRAMGIQCRLVMNLVPLPIRPAIDDLCSIKLKKTEEKNSIKQSSNKSSIKEKNTKSELSQKQHKTQALKQKNDKDSVKNCPNILKNDNSNKKTNLKCSSKQSTAQTATGSFTVPKIKVTEVKSGNISKCINKDKEIKVEKKNASPIKTRTQRKMNAGRDEKKNDNTIVEPISGNSLNSVKRRTPSPKFHISPQFITSSSEKMLSLSPQKCETRSTRFKKNTEKSNTTNRSRKTSPKMSISPTFCQKKSSRKDDNNEKKKISLKDKLNLKIPQLDGADSIPKSKKNKKSLKDKIYADNSDTDSDFETSPPKKPKLTTKLSKIDRRVLSTDDENINDEPENSSDPKNKKTMDIWVEVYSETEDQWISIDLFKTKIHCADSLRKGATGPVSYVFAWNNDNSLKDVSPRYCPQWNTVTRKQRVEKEWLEKAIRKYIGVKHSRDIAEDRELEKIHMDKPLPTTIMEFKNHPLYALERNLLKFEAIYPPNTPTLGFVRSEPIYPRDCIHTLHSRDIWLKVAKVVKPGEKPYKIVTARPKWDKATSSVIKDLPLEIFGFWQTMDYEPPTAENGIVPRNAYGNVELFKPTMLPKKTVHLQLPGLNRVCKKLRIDCAPAVVGFDFHQGLCHPLLDGFVVCEEFKDQVIQAWEDDQQDQARKELEKFETRVYGNWKRLIKGLLIRERLKIKYNFGEFKANDKTKIKRKK